jgi:hypothetical protein
MANPLDTLKFSNNQAFASMSPEDASRFAVTLYQVLGTERGKAALSRLGISRADIIDTPISVAGIKALRGEPREPETTGQRIGTAFIEEPIRGLQDVFASFGIGESEPSEEETARIPEDVPLVGGQTPGRVAGSLLGNLALFGGGLSITKNLASKILSSSPRAAQIASFGATVGGLETAREVGELASTGDPIDIGDIAAETAIGMAAGLPVGRIAAAAAAGGTASAASALGADIPGERILAEMAMGGLFGNPKLNAKLKGKPSTEDLADLQATVTREPGALQAKEATRTEAAAALRAENQQIAKLKREAFLESDPVLKRIRELRATTSEQLANSFDSPALERIRNVSSTIQYILNLSGESLLMQRPRRKERSVPQMPRYTYVSL